MGTRSTVKFYNENDKSKKPIVSIYNQYDGYIVDGIGHELANWLKNKKIVNGYSYETMEEEYANGMSCLAAQYIKDHKVRIGGLYITSADDEQDYNYRVKYINKQLIIEVDDFFKGTPEELLNFK